MRITVCLRHFLRPFARGVSPASLQPKSCIIVISIIMIIQDAFRPKIVAIPRLSGCMKRSWER